MHIAYIAHFGGPEATTASKQPRRSNQTRFEISDPNYLLIHVHIVFMVWALLAASEATTVSKQRLRLKLSLQVKLVTPIYYITKFQGIFISLTRYGPNRPAARKWRI